jgi:hypothetical protein
MALLYRTYPKSINTPRKQMPDRKSWRESTQNELQGLAHVKITRHYIEEFPLRRTDCTENIFFIFADHTNE